MQYVVREEEDILSGALVSKTCGSSMCTGKEEYATGVLWGQSYYFLRASFMPRIDAIEQRTIHQTSSSVKSIVTLLLHIPYIHT